MLKGGGIRPVARYCIARPAGSWPGLSRSRPRLGLGLWRGRGLRAWCRLAACLEPRPLKSPCSPSPSRCDPPDLRPLCGGGEEEEEAAGAVVCGATATRAGCPSSLRRHASAQRRQQHARRRKQSATRGLWLESKAERRAPALWSRELAAPRSQGRAAGLAPPRPPLPASPSPPRPPSPPPPPACVRPPPRRTLRLHRCSPRRSRHCCRPLRRRHRRPPPPAAAAVALL